VNGAYFTVQAHQCKQALHESRKAYHHGDLRSALVALALEHVRKDGAESFSLREAARGAGVTSGAAYKHFADKDELLSAVATEALALLAQRSMKATAGLTGRKRLHASALSYIDFAAAEPRLFRLAFSRFGSDLRTEKDGVRARSSSCASPSPNFRPIRANPSIRMRWRWPGPWCTASHR
jgi:AcrR family transcriptional regulator